MSVERNKELVRRYLDRVVSRGDMAAADELVGTEIVFTSPYTPEPLHGRDAFKQMIAGLRAAFPDLKIEEEAVIAEENLVATRWFATGTQREAFGTLPATGRQFRITGMSIYRLKDGRIVEGWVNDDTLGMLTQLGAIPAGVGA